MCNGLERYIPALTVVIPGKNELEESWEWGKSFNFFLHISILFEILIS